MKIIKYNFIILILLLILSFIINMFYYYIPLHGNLRKMPIIYNINIKNAYSIWSPSKMQLMIKDVSENTYGTCDPSCLLNRSYKSMYVEWWLHNIGYYISRPFCFIDYMYNINLRCKDVDLEAW